MAGAAVEAAVEAAEAAETGAGGAGAAGAAGALRMVAEVLAGPGAKAVPEATGGRGAEEGAALKNADDGRFRSRACVTHSVRLHTFKRTKPHAHTPGLYYRTLTTAQLPQSTPQESQ